jgi:hypothetical protein
MNAAREIGPEGLDAVALADVEDIHARAEAMELTASVECVLEFPLSFWKASV